MKKLLLLLLGVLCSASMAWADAVHISSLNPTPLDMDNMSPNVETRVVIYSDGYNNSGVKGYFAKTSTGTTHNTTINFGVDNDYQSIVYYITKHDNGTFSIKHHDGTYMKASDGQLVYSSDDSEKASIFLDTDHIHSSHVGKCYYSLGYLDNETKHYFHRNSGTVNVSSTGTNWVSANFFTFTSYEDADLVKGSSATVFEDGWYQIQVSDGNEQNHANYRGYYMTGRKTSDGWPVLTSDVNDPSTLVYISKSGDNFNFTMNKGTDNQYYLGSDSKSSNTAGAISFIPASASNDNVNWAIRGGGKQWLGWTLNGSPAIGVRTNESNNSSFVFHKVSCVSYTFQVKYGETLVNSTKYNGAVGHSYPRNPLPYGVEIKTPLTGMIKDEDDGQTLTLETQTSSANEIAWSADEANVQWQALGVRGKNISDNYQVAYLCYNGSNFNYLDSRDNNFNTTFTYDNYGNYEWGFIGTPFGFKIVNRKAGEGKYLTGTNDIEFNTTGCVFDIQQSTASEKRWGNFVIHNTENTGYYLHSYNTGALNAWNGGNSAKGDLGSQITILAPDGLMLSQVKSSATTFINENASILDNASSYITAINNATTLDAVKAQTNEATAEIASKQYVVTVQYKYTDDNGSVQTLKSDVVEYPLDQTTNVQVPVSLTALQNKAIKSLTYKIGEAEPVEISRGENVLSEFHYSLPAMNITQDLIITVQCTLHPLPQTGKLYRFISEGNDRAPHMFKNSSDVLKARSSSTRGDKAEMFYIVESTTGVYHLVNADGGKGYPEITWQNGSCTASYTRTGLFTFTRDNTNLAILVGQNGKEGNLQYLHVNGSDGTNVVVWNNSGGNSRWFLHEVEDSELDEKTASEVIAEAEANVVKVVTTYKATWEDKEEMILGTKSCYVQSNKTLETNDVPTWTYYANDRIEGDNLTVTESNKNFTIICTPNFPVQVGKIYKIHSKNSPNNDYDCSTNEIFYSTQVSSPVLGGKYWMFERVRGTENLFLVKNLGQNKYLTLKGTGRQTAEIVTTPEAWSSGTGRTSYIRITPNSADGNGFNLQHPGDATTNCGSHIDGQVGTWQHAGSASNNSSCNIATLVTTETFKTDFSSSLASEPANVATDRIGTGSALVPQSCLQAFNDAKENGTMASVVTYFRTKNNATFADYGVEGKLFRWFSHAATSHVMQPNNLSVDSDDNYSNVHLMQSNTTDNSINSLFAFEAGDNGNYYIKHLNSGLYVGPATKTTNQGNAINLVIKNNAAQYSAKINANNYCEFKDETSDNGVGIHDANNSSGIVGWTETSTESNWTLNLVENIPVTIGSSRFSTICFPMPVSIPENVKAYIVIAKEENNLVLEEISGAIKANIPIIVEADPTTYSFGIVENGDEKEYCDEILKGSTIRRTGFTENSFYALAADSDAPKGVSFQRNGSVSAVPANKAYLELPASPVHAYFFLFDDDTTTEIESAKAKLRDSDKLYNLQGCAVNRYSRGVYVNENRRKIFIAK